MRPTAKASQDAFALLQKPDESAKVVIVTMAQHESIQFSWVNGQQTGVVVECFRRETEVHQKVARLTTTLGLGMHRQTELADQRPAGRLIAAEAPAEVLHVDRPRLLARYNGELVAVDHDANRNSVHFGNAAGDRLCPHRLRASKE